MVGKRCRSVERSTDDLLSGRRCSATIVIVGRRTARHAARRHRIVPAPPRRGPARGRPRGSRRRRRRIGRRRERTAHAVLTRGEFPFPVPRLRNSREHAESSGQQIHRAYRGGKDKNSTFLQGMDYSSTSCLLVLGPVSFLRYGRPRPSLLRVWAANSSCASSGHRLFSSPLLQTNIRHHELCVILNDRIDHSMKMNQLRESSDWNFASFRP